MLNMNFTKDLVMCEIIERHESKSIIVVVKKIYCRSITQNDTDFFFIINSFLFLFFSHITQHNIQNITKQNNRHILNISRSNQRGGREGRTIKTQKSLLYTITYIHQKTLPSINGRGPGPTNSRRCTFT